MDTILISTLATLAGKWQAEAWAQGLGFVTHRIPSEGMAGLVGRKKAWPRGGGGKYQFCTVLWAMLRPPKD